MVKEYQKTCKYCQEDFTTRNLRKETCSNTCKTYYSQQKHGRLNGTQQAIKNGEIKSVEKNQNIIVQKSTNQNTINQLLIGHIESIFAIEGELSPITSYGDKENKYGDSYIHPYWDVVKGTRKIQVTSNGNFLITSISPLVIDYFISNFNGSKRFKAYTKKVKNYSINMKGNLDLSEPESLMYLSKNEKDKILNREVEIELYSTIIPRENLLEKSGIPIELI